MKEKLKYNYYIAIKFGSDIHAPFMINFNNFNDPFFMVSTNCFNISVFPILWFLTKFL